ncbi:hypothetical protein, partial [Nocardia rhamnosiphila]
WGSPRLRRLAAVVVVLVCAVYVIQPPRLAPAAHALRRLNGGTGLDPFRASPNSAPTGRCRP